MNNNIFEIGTIVRVFGRSKTSLYRVDGHEKHSRVTENFSSEFILYHLTNIETEFKIKESHENLLFFSKPEKEKEKLLTKKEINLLLDAINMYKFQMDMYKDLHREFGDLEYEECYELCKIFIEETIEELKKGTKKRG